MNEPPPPVGEVQWRGWINLSYRRVACAIVTGELAPDVMWFYVGRWDFVPYAEVREAVFAAAFRVRTVDRDAARRARGFVDAVLDYCEANLFALEQASQRDPHAGEQASVWRTMCELIFVYAASSPESPAIHERMTNRRAAARRFVSRVLTPSHGRAFDADGAKDALGTMEEWDALDNLDRGNIFKAGMDAALRECRAVKVAK